MSYDALIQRLYAINRFGGYRPGLKNIERLNQLLADPTRSFESVHIAGTNGKGSVTTKIAKALEVAGYRVGCYTSPHIACFRERIRVNGQMISESDVEHELMAIFDLMEREAIPATFFEVTTAMAFAYFASAGIDIAVLETGLGGRFDATNCVTPKLSVITSISLDHTDILGHSREDIAWEKAGIIKPGVPVVIGPQANLPIILNVANQQGSAVHAVAAVDGEFDAENSAIARRALQVLQVDDNAVVEGLRHRPSCRFEKVPKEILQQSELPHWPSVIILDVGHNPDAMQKLINALDTHYPGHPCDFLCGFSKNKDIVSCLQTLKPKVRDLHLIQAQHDRAEAVAMLERYALDAGIEPARITAWASAKEAVAGYCAVPRSQDTILVVCGSFFAMAEARAALGYREPQDFVNLNER